MIRHKIILLILLLVCLKNVQSIQMLPLCAICAIDDTYSCTSCGTCTSYAVLSPNNYCSCRSSYYINNVDPTNVYCDRCDTSCLTCFGPLSSNCLTCSSRFVYQQVGSSCVPPNNSSDQTIDAVYSYYGFSILPYWYRNQAGSISTTKCNGRTILGGPYVLGGADTINRVYSLTALPYHFALRVKLAFYIFNSAAITNAKAWISISNSIDTTINRTYSGQTTSINSCGLYYVHFNIDDSFLHIADTVSVQIGLTDTNQYFGIRQFYLIAQKCNALNCTQCVGYDANQCTLCTDPLRLSTFTGFVNTCLCSGNYYQEPYAGKCVDPCPSVPIRYYGDPTTRYCKTSCPIGYYALDDTYRCVTACPTTSTKSLLALYKDITNRRCVNVCPETEPYAYPTDGVCYSTCPGGTFASDAATRQCVPVCPQNTVFKLYGYLGKCIPNCPLGFWGDPFTKQCRSDCLSSPYLFKDNSTGFPVCVSMCPAPNFFGDATTYSCVETCPATFYGERYAVNGVTVIQLCLSMCNAPRWGLVDQNRKCVDICPQSFWAIPSTRVCTNNSVDCAPLYADNYTRVCVVPTDCSNGYFAANSSSNTTSNNYFRCVPYCPSGSFAHPNSKVCQAQCLSPYFADKGINACVLVCSTIGTYADASSSRTCVPSCNITGTTPWADDSTRTCVSDCNNTITTYVADNTTWQCVYDCPANTYADLTTLAPKCVVVCPTNYYADNSTGSGLCVPKCPAYPRLFGDWLNGFNRCVSLCTSVSQFGDQTGFRLCSYTCPSVYYAQNDSNRLCVTTCKAGTYGSANVCLTDPRNCPTGQFGDDSTNKCVPICPSIQGTFGDPVSRLCVLKCPVNPNYPTSGPATYYADPSNQLCVLTCNATYLGGSFGNNNTRTCVTKCQDTDSFAEVQTVNRICVARCLPAVPIIYANNQTKICGVSWNCPLNYYGENNTQLCVNSCPAGSFAYQTLVDKICIDQCPVNLIPTRVDWYGDTSTTKRICVTQCPSVPLSFADPTTKLCVPVCPSLYYGETIGRTCVTLCPHGTFAHENSRRCVAKCPNTFFGDNTQTIRYCYSTSAQCGSKFGDPYLNLCVGTCTGPSPVNLFGLNDDCVSNCTTGFYADSETGTRLCVSNCPDRSGIGGNDLYGDPTTLTCTKNCITPLTFADYQTRDCQSTCSALPIPTYSNTYTMRCVTSLNCPNVPLSPSMTFGDNATRSCQANCTNDTFGDPTLRNCVSQCLKSSQTGTEHYYGDKSTGINLCVTVCPSTPILFGQNTTNLCVSQCPALTYGDQTGKRSCVPQCPIVSLTYYYAQNLSRICVKVCVSGTWGRKSSRQCVEDPNLCLTQWADNTTNMCVPTCPVGSNTFADPTTKFCVPLCPSTYYSDVNTRTCVQGCPSNYGVQGTFADNTTRQCQQYCSEPNAFADSQTVNRHCVLLCSQTPSQAFADSSTKRCVKRCPTFPDLYGETQGYTCVSKCVSPYYANTNTRRCQLECPDGQFKLNSSRLCVRQCPSDLDLYADSNPNSKFCVSTCTRNYQRYPTLRTCVPSCKALILKTYDSTCIKFCPFGYYADSDGICVPTCPPLSFGQNTTTQCVPTCITGYAQGSLCVAKCDDGLFGQESICKSGCTYPNRASNLTNLCVSNCQDLTYMINNKCQSSCITGYADPNTRLCSSDCTNGLVRDSSTKKCVQTCPTGSYRDDVEGSCLTDCSPYNRNKDNITGKCQVKCSNGTWGYNNVCVSKCPALFYGYTETRYCRNIANRPDTALFADNQTQTWVADCPLNPLLFRDATKKQCVSSCVQGQFADPFSRNCETNCKNLSYFADSTTKSCVLICPLGYFANTANNLCESQCSGGKYNYQPSNMCVSTCPAPYYGYNNPNTTLICLLRCPSNTYAQGRKCQTGCTTLFADDSTNMCVANCIGSYANINTHRCQSQCATFSLIADSSTNQCVGQCPIDPDFYKLNGVCVAECSNTTFADPTPGTRQCTSGCPDGLWAQPQSRRCLPTCKPGYFGRNFTNTCDTTCLLGEYADYSTGFCQTSCPSPTFADSLSHKCQQVCTHNQLAENGACVVKCTTPNYANPLTQKCQLGCPSFANLFAQNTTRSCVPNCSIVPNSYADTHLRLCVSDCTYPLEYALDGQALCTTLCPHGLFMDNQTFKCKANCVLGFAELTSRYCVQRCFGAPNTYGFIDANLVKTCRYNCSSATTNLYADNRTNLCVQTCVTPMYSDPLTGNCVLFCPEGFWAEDALRTCTIRCSATQFADNLTRKCVDQCPTSTQETFGDLGTNRCVRICPNGYFARNDTKQCVLAIDCAVGSWADVVSKYCVARCPSDTQTFGYNTTKQCIPQCPLTQTEDLFGQFTQQTCVSGCLTRNGLQTYADSYTRTCVFRCSILQNLWADTNGKRCRLNCSNSQIRDNSTQSCVVKCPSNPESYADLVTTFCVRTCPNGKFASDSFNRVCTSDCSLYSLTFGDNTTNRCTNKCPIPYFADNSTYLCVLNCPEPYDYYADLYSRKCVLNCPKSTDWVSYADPLSRSCVTKCPNGSYAVNSTQRCLPKCPLNQYADKVLNLCVQFCTVRPHHYIEIDSRICVEDCPTTPVLSFKYDTNHSCVYALNGKSGCPDAFYADPTTYMCTILCPPGYFAQDSSKMCVKNCSADYVADPTDRRCKTSCTTTVQYYAYDLIRICVQQCPAPYFNNNKTFRCTQDCSQSPLMFRQYKTRKCVQNCYYPYFAYSVNRTCLLACPYGWFAQDSTLTCVVACDSPYFADNSTNKCVNVCPQNPNYYGHLNICKFYCPDNLYRDNTTRLCVSNCPIQPLMFADSSTNTCVKYCPADKNFFADNITRTCVLNCTSGLFAQVQSRKCLKTCPKNLQTYADPTTRVCKSVCPPTYYTSDVTKECVQLCPNQPVNTYAHLTACITKCPRDFYGQNTTRVCRKNCSNIANIFADPTSNLCVSVCPVTLYAQNHTDSCVQKCPNNSYADPTTRVCVTDCPGDSQLFADPSTSICVSMCPNGRYGDSVSWKCLVNCPDTSSGYRLDVGRLCVQQCPSPYFAYIPTTNCVKNCGQRLYGDPVTRTCKNCPPTCPTCLSLTQCMTCTSGLYLSYGQCTNTCILNNDLANYANEDTRSCVVALRCPSGYYGNNATISCVRNCPAKMYQNASLKTCENCPQYCSACTGLTVCTTCTSEALYSAEDTTCYPFCSATDHFYLESTCVNVCPNGTYIDYTQINCMKCNQICMNCYGNALNCTECDKSFKFNNTCLSQCPSNYYALNGACTICSENVTSCTTPLTFQVQQTTQNFQPVLIIKFNQNVSLKSKPSKFVKVMLSMKSRGLQSDSNLINNGVQFDAIVLPDGTIKLLLNPGVNLQNANFNVVFTDSSQIQTDGGQSLQSLQASIILDSANIYPTSVLQNSSSLGKVAMALSIIILMPIFLLFVCSPIAMLFSLESFQIISLFAYVSQLPPNLFIFLKQLRYSRLSFLPSIFANVYTTPGYFTDKIPVNLVQTQGVLSFAVNAGGFSIFVFLYSILFAIIYAGSSKLNSNRPLRNVITQIYNSRILYGVIHDFVWIFALNILTSAFMQFRFTDNGGDAALGTIFMLLILVGIGFLTNQLRKYNKLDNSIDKQQKNLLRTRLSYYLQGLKQQPVRYYTNTIYYVRKILFSICIAAFVNQPFAQAICLVILPVLMIVYFAVMRPYADNFRNLMHLLNQLGFMFVACGIIYFLQIQSQNQPMGHKIDCGNIITYVIIIHLTVAILWAYFRCYFFLKQIYLAFKQTQFYKLSLDEQYDTQLEKQIRQLNADEKGQIQSVQITNAGDHDAEQIADQDRIIKLKIKRRRIKTKINTNQQSTNKRHNKDDYIKLNQSAQKDETIKIQTKVQNKMQRQTQQRQTQQIIKTKKINKQQEFQKIQFNSEDNQKQILTRKQSLKQIKKPDFRKSIHEEEWIAMKIDKSQNSQIQKQNHLKQLQNKHENIFDNEGYAENNNNDQIFDMIQSQHNNQQQILIANQQIQNYNRQQGYKNQQKQQDKDSKISQNYQQRHQIQNAIAQKEQQQSNYEQDFEHEVELIKQSSHKLVQFKKIELQNIQISRNHLESSIVPEESLNVPKKQTNNWAELQNIMQDDEKKNMNKKKIQMMIFDDEDFQSEN